MLVFQHVPTANPYLALLLLVPQAELQQPHLYQTMTFSNCLALGIIVYASRYGKHTKILRRGVRMNLDRCPQR